MTIVFRDFFEFPFNEGRGIRTNQIDGLVEVPIGTSDNDALRWDTGTDNWVATQIPSANQQRTYPYFVLTANPDGDELKAALDWYLENPPGSMRNEQLQAGQPFSVEGGFHYARSIREITGFSRINEVWLEGAPAATWWAVVNALTDRAEGYWIRYTTANEIYHNLWMAVTDDGNPDASDFVDLGELRSGEPFTFPVFADDSFLSFWFPPTVTRVGVFGFTRLMNDFALSAFGLPALNQAASYTDLEIGGVAGRFITTRRALSSTTYSGTTRVVSMHPRGEDEYFHHDQHTAVITVETSFIRVNGVLHDVARSQIVGPRPDNSADRVLPNSLWAYTSLGYTAPAATGPSSELVTTTQLRGFRFAPPAMYYGWADSIIKPGELEPSPSDIDFTTLARSQTLQGLLPRHNRGRAYLVVWISEEALGGKTCTRFDIGVDELILCGLESFEGPDGRPGHIFIGRQQVALAGRFGQLLTVTPADMVEDEEE